MNPSRTSRSLSALMLAMVVSVWLAPSAHAQLSGALDSTVGTVEETVGDSGSGSVVGGITDGLEGDSSGAGSDNQGSTDDGGGGNGGGLIGGVVDKIDDAVEEGKGTVTEVTDTTGDTLGNVGAGTVGGIVGAVEGTVGEVGSGLNGKGGKQKKDGRRNATDVGSVSPAYASLVLSSSLADALQADSKNVGPSLTADAFTTIASAATSDESLVQQIGRIAAEAVKNAAFPLALILFVGGFLMVQNRIDSRDPKLALAPVDSEHDLLSFS